MALSSPSSPLDFSGGGQRPEIMRATRQIETCCRNKAAKWRQPKQLATWLPSHRMKKHAGILLSNATVSWDRVRHHNGIVARLERTQYER
jgi:hypothetical protein